MGTMKAETRSQLLDAGKRALLASGYAGLSTRRVAEAAGVPLSQIHYHFGSRQNLVLALLAEENELPAGASDLGSTEPRCRCGASGNRPVTSSRRT